MSVPVTCRRIVGRLVIELNIACNQPFEVKIESLSTILLGPRCENCVFDENRTVGDSNSVDDLNVFKVNSTGRCGPPQFT